MNDTANKRPDSAEDQPEQPPALQSPPQEPPTPPYNYQPPTEGQQPPYPPYPPQYPYPAPPQAPQQISLRTLLPAGLALLGILIMSALFLLGGEFAAFAGVGLQFAPFAILGALAYAGAKNTVAAVFTYVWVAILALLLAMIALLFAVGPFLNMGATGTTDFSNPFKPGVGAALLWTMLMLGLGGIVSAAMLLRPVRVKMARIMPIDPDNFVHKIALCIITFMLFGLFAPLVALGGKPPLLELLSNDALQDASTGLSVRPQDLAYQFLWMIPATLIAAGWLVARNFRETMVRLGMVRPTLVQVGAALALAGVLAAFAAFLLDPGITELWKTLGWPITDVEAFTDMMAQLITPAGAVLVGFVAGVSEEMAYRGLLQPRIGLIGANLLFTASHAFQYGFDALLSVFIVGLILGVIRARSNTTTAAIVHGVYDFILVLGSYLVGQQ